MTKKTAPAKNKVAKPGGRQKAKSKTPRPASDLKHQIKIQQALYEIATAASAVTDMPAFYKRLHEIVGTLMYAGNFFIATYDEQSGLLSFPYFVDEVDKASPTQPLADFHGLTSWIIRTGYMGKHGWDQADQLMASGEIEMVGTPNEDGMIAPLKADGKVIGAVAMQSYTKGIEYTDEDEDVLEFVAQHIAIALTRARAIDETRQRNSELAIINSVQEGLASKLDMQGIYDLVGNKICEIFDAQGVSIASYDPAASLLHFHYSIQEGERIQYDPAPLSDKGFRAHIIRTRQSLRLDDVEVQGTKYGLAMLKPANATTVAKSDAPKSWLGVPLLVGGKVSGVVNLYNVDRANAYSDSDVRLLETLANSMSVALENARLFDEVQKKNVEITESLERETTSNNILQVIAESPTDIQPVLDVIARNAAQLSGSEDAIISLRDGDILRVDAHYGDIPMIPIGEGIRFDQDSVAGRAILEGRPRQGIHNQRGVKSEYPAGDKVAKKYGYRMTCAVPLMREGKAIGCISIRRLKPELLNEKQIALIQSFANQAAIAVENVRLFEAEQQRNAELAIINEIGQGLARELNFQAIIDLVGDKVRDIFSAQATMIFLYDATTNILSYPYFHKHGQRFHSDPRQINPQMDPGFLALIIRSQQRVIINQDLDQEMLKIGESLMSGTSMFESMAYVPILAGDQVIGVLGLESKDKNAFPELTVNLLTTIAANLGVALENARLFDETQRLLKETEDRAAELAVINSVQEGLASKLDMQAIYDLVGDKLRDIFDVQGVLIIHFDHATQTQYIKYLIEMGKRLYPDPKPFTGLTRFFVKTKELIVINENMQQRINEFITELGAEMIPGAVVGKSGIFAPLVAQNAVRGMMVLENFNHENAFSVSDAHLIETLANSMSVALENARLFDETQRLLKETEDRAAELVVINRVQEGLASKLDYHAIVDLVGETIREIFHTQNLSIGRYDHASQMVDYSYVVQNGQRTYYEPMAFSGVAHHLIRTRQMLLVSENVKQKMDEIGSHWSDLEIPQTLIYVPLIAGEMVTGVVAIYDFEREHAFSDSDIRLLQTLCNSMSVALENARLWEQEKLYRKALQRELEIGREIQSGFLPETLPQVEGWEIAASLLSAREVAGDFYDAFELPDGTIGLVIADVCDKGVGAALFMTLFRSLIRAVSRLDYFEHTEQVNASYSAAERLQRAVSLTNNYIAETHGDSGMFATVFFGILDPHNGKLTYINGGHEPPLIIRQGAVRTALRKTGPAVGAFLDCYFQVDETQLRSDDILFAFTDGVPDCTDPHNEFYGRERLLNLLQQTRGSAHELVKTVQAALQQYIANATQFDDITLLAVRRG